MFGRPKQQATLLPENSPLFKSQRHSGMQKRNCVEKERIQQSGKIMENHHTSHFMVEEIAALKFMSTKDILSKESSDTKSSNLEQRKKSSGISGVSKYLTNHALK